MTTQDLEVQLNYLLIKKLKIKLYKFISRSWQRIGKSPDNCPFEGFWQIKKLKHFNRTAQNKPWAQSLPFFQLNESNPWISTSSFPFSNSSTLDQIIEPTTDKPTHLVKFHNFECVSFDNQSQTLTNLSSEKLTSPKNHKLDSLDLAKSPDAISVTPTFTATVVPTGNPTDGKEWNVAGTPTVLTPPQLSTISILTDAPPSTHATPSSHSLLQTTLTNKQFPTPIGPAVPPEGQQQTVQGDRNDDRKN